MPGFPLLIDVRPLTSRTSVEVCDELGKMVAYFEALQSEGFAIGETSRVKRIHSDRAGEFTAPFFAKFLAHHKTIHHSFTSGDDPQSNGTAERSVGVIKALAARALATARLDPSYWSYATRHAAQSLICHSLQKRQLSLPFGTTVAAQVLGHKDVKFPHPRSFAGRLIFWDHLNDQVSCLLCPSENASSEPCVYRAGLPVRLPPGVNLDDLVGLDPQPQPLAFKTPLKRDDSDDHFTSDKPIDLDATDPIDLDAEDELNAEISLTCPDALLEESPFTFLYLSSEDSLQDEALEDLSSSDPSLDDLKKQGVTHIPVTAEQVLQSDGEERWKWMQTGRKELDNLSSTGTTESISQRPRRSSRLMPKQLAQNT